MLITILDLILLTQLSVSIYSFISIKDANYGEQDGDNAKKLSLTVLLSVSILFLIINGFYLWDVVNEKRAILGLAFLAIISSCFIFVNYSYLEDQMKSHPNYNTSLDNLNNNSENTNKTPKNLNLYTGIITIILSVILLVFYVGYYFYSRQIIKKVLQPVIIENKSGKRKSAKINLKDKYLI